MSLKTKRFEPTTKRDELKPEVYAALFSNLTVGLAILDLSGVIVEVNPALQKMLGTPVSHLIGRPLDTICQAQERHAIHKLWNEAVALQRPASEILLRCRHDSGGDLWGRLTVSLVSSGGKPAFAIAQIADDTLRRGTEVTANARGRQLSIIEEALLNSEKLACVGRMAATIAHEINNPLEAVLNLVYLARMSTPNDETKEFLLSAEREIARISHITKQTLAFYRDTTAPSQLDLSVLVDDTISLYQRNLLKKNLVVHTRLQRPVMLTGFGGELKQVISNLLANAIDVCEERSSISVRTRVCGEFVQLTVADRGVGIPPELHAHIFDPFFTTKKHAGTGLGLWVTRGIVEKHHGSIRLRSRTGAKGGTIFMVRLPRTMPTPTPAG
jgi:PAS domain S-box-containing protein